MFEASHKNAIARILNWQRFSSHLSFNKVYFNTALYCFYISCKLNTQIISEIETYYKDHITGG